jgi:cbb3-type cytochrome oxidase subunit 3
MSFGTTMAMFTLASFIAFVLVIVYALIARRERMDKAARAPLDDEGSLAEALARGVRR